MGTTRMPTPIRPKKANGKEQNVYWIRKKVPKRYRALVGKSEVWRSLKTTDRRTANLRIAVVSAELEQEWTRLALEAKRSPKDSSAAGRLTHQDLFAIQRETHIRIRDARIADPRSFAALRSQAFAEEPATQEDAEELDGAAREILAREGATHRPARAECEAEPDEFVEGVADRLEGRLDEARTAPR
jgi:hypothetical protein